MKDRNGIPISVGALMYIPSVTDDGESTFTKVRVVGPAIGGVRIRELSGYHAMRPGAESTVMSNLLTATPPRADRWAHLHIPSEPIEEIAA